MKVNKWTMGLAAVGLVSLPSVLQAEEKQLSPLQTALNSTVISGYVNTAAQWDFGTGNANPPAYIYNSRNKQDAFSLNVVDLTIEKPLDEAQWSAGYRADLWFGQDANTFASQSPFAAHGDFAIKQAYVALRAPVGNGLDFKMGAFDSIIGYESHDAGKNPNYTRSYGTSIEPHTLTGLLASYQFNDMVTLKGGIANTYGPTINENANPPKAESYKAYTAEIALTAPKEMGFLEGSTLYAGFINGFNSGLAQSPADAGNLLETSYYVGATVATPIKELRLGAAWDYADVHQAGFACNFAGYASFQATEKLSLHVRGEYLKGSQIEAITGLPNRATEVTATIQYDLWKNVMSRLEFRWDHAANDVKSFGGVEQSNGSVTKMMDNSYALMLNIIYMF